MARLVFAALAAFCIATAMAEKERLRRETLDPFTLAAEIDFLKGTLDTLAEGSSKNGPTLGALSGAIAPTAASIGRIDELIQSVDDLKIALVKMQAVVEHVKSKGDDIDGLVKDAKSNEDSLTVMGGKLGPCCTGNADVVKAKANVAKKDVVDKVEGDVNDAAKKIKSSALTQIEKVAQSVASAQALDKLESDLRTGIDAAKAAAEQAASKGGSASVYVNWGSYKCNGKGVTTLYSGWTYGNYHDHKTAPQNYCAKDAGGSLGGNDVGGADSMDLMYRMSTNGCSSYIPGIPCDRTIPCSMCRVENHCYTERGVPECSAEGYKPKYSGWLMGTYHSHQAVTDRICVDSKGSGWNQGRHDGSYLYPSKAQSGMSKRKSNLSLRCHVCCKE